MTADVFDRVNMLLSKVNNVPYPAEAEEIVPTMESSACHCPSYTGIEERPYIASTLARGCQIRRQVRSETNWKTIISETSWVAFGGESTHGDRISRYRPDVPNLLKYRSWLARAMMQSPATSTI